MVRMTLTLAAILVTTWAFEKAIAEDDCVHPVVYTATTGTLRLHDPQLRDPFDALPKLGPQSYSEPKPIPQTHTQRDSIRSNFVGETAHDNHSQPENSTKLATAEAIHTLPPLELPPSPAVDGPVKEAATPAVNQTGYVDACELPCSGGSRGLGLLGGCMGSCNAGCCGVYATLDGTFYRRNRAEQQDLIQDAILGPVVLHSQDADFDNEGGVHITFGRPIGCDRSVEVSYLGIWDWSGSASVADENDLHQAASFSPIGSLNPGRLLQFYLR